MKTYTTYTNTTPFRVKLRAVISLWMVFLILPVSVNAQQAVSKVKNAVTVTVPTQPVTNVSEINANNSLTSIQYTDGLGRENMTVAKGITPTGKDLVNMVSYDMEGNVKEQWLPIPVSGHTPTQTSTSLISTAKTFYNDTHPYSAHERTYDGLYMQTSISPGKDWHNNRKEQVLISFPNLAQGQDPLWVIPRYKLEGNGVRKTGIYPAHALQGQYFEDEDGKKQLAFYDAQGKLILERKVYSESGKVYYDTYYVYDEKGLLRYVLPPEATARMTSASTIYTSQGLNTANNPIDQYGFIYQYDDWGRCIKKKLPGADWIFYVYDKAGRLIMMQDGNQREKSEWSFTIYDLYGRVIQEGIVSLVNRNQHNLMIHITKDKVVTEQWTGNGYSYTSRLFMDLKEERIVTRTNYYDNYAFLDIPKYSSIKSNLLYAANSSYGQKATRMVNGVDVATLGLLTGSETRLLDGSGATTEAYYYDDRGRVIQKKVEQPSG